MRNIAFCFYCFYMCGAFAAPALLCDNGYFNGTECVPYAQDGCATGYTKQNVIGFGVAANGGCGGVATQGKGISEYKSLGVGMCDGGYYNGSECVPYAQDACATGYTKQNVIGFGLSVNGVCAGAVTQGKGISEYKSLGVGMCDGGYYNGSECVSYAKTELCPDDYNEISNAMSFRAVADGIDCPSGTTAISAYDGSHLPDEKQMLVWSYPYDSTPDNMIALRMCGAGQEMNYLGNCANLCAVPGLRYLRSDTGVVVPVYASKITVPSLNIRSGNAQKCYVNLLPESGVGAINVRYNDALYHTVN